MAWLVYRPFKRISSSTLNVYCRTSNGNKHVYADARHIRRGQPPKREVYTQKKFRNAVARCFSALSMVQLQSEEPTASPSAIRPMPNKQQVLPTYTRASQLLL